MRNALVVITWLTLASSGLAQQPAGDQNQSAYLRRSYEAVARDVTAAVEMMAEGDLTFRPAGVTTDVRTFGEIAAHLAQANAFICAMGDGQPDRSASINSAVAKDKARLLAALKDTDSRCLAYIATVTDAQLGDVLTAGSGERRMQTIRGHSLMFMVAHSNEHYGNLVTYLRAKGLVPPVTPSQASFLSPIR